MMNCQANYMAHLAAAIPNHVMMEVFGTPDREHVFKSWDNEIQDGFIVMGDSYGLGLEIDYDALKNLQDTDYGRAPNSPWPRREGAGLEVKPLDEKEVDWI
jgi:L-alanine-DL-glutamate epimerase-like enolase superfamily enzyme